MPNSRQPPIPVLKPAHSVLSARRNVVRAHTLPPVRTGWHRLPFVSAATEAEEKFALPLDMASQQDAGGKTVTEAQMEQVHASVLETIGSGVGFAYLNEDVNE